MSPEPTSYIVPDEDKTREQLLSELRELRAREAVLREAGVKSRSIAEAMRENEERLLVQVDDVPVLVWVTGPDGAEFVNRAYLEFLGVSGQADVQRFDWARYVHPDDREGYLNTYLDCFNRRIPFSAMFRFRRHDGEYRWMKSTGQPRYTPAGEFSGFVGSTQDITDVKLAEEEVEKYKKHLEDLVQERTAELRESEAKYRAVVDNQTEMITRFTPDYTLTFVNEAVLRYIGLEYEDLVGHSVLEFLPPNQHAMFKDSVASLNKNNRTAMVENYVVLPSEEVRWQQWIITAVLDDEGRVKEIQSVGRDVTERKQAEDALRESQELLRAVIEGIPDPIFIKDRQSRILMANPATLRVIGKPLEEVIGKDDRKHYTDPAIGEALMANDRRIMESGKTEVIEEVVQTPEGYRTFISTKTPYRNSKGEVIGILGIAQDITERKKAEEQLARQAELLSMVYDGVWAVDAEFRFTYWNKGAERILGWTAEEALGKAANDLLKTRIEGASREESIKKMLQAGHYEGEASYLHKDGYYVPVEVNFSVVKGQDGETRGLIVTGRDITERKRAEEELKAAKQQVELYLDLMSHDINNMHQVALGYLELARDMPAGGAQVAFIDKSAEVLQRSTQLISNVRKLQKLHDGVLIATDIDVRKLLTEIQSEFGAVSGKMLTLSMDGQDSCFVRADELLHDVFSNLVINAIKHTGEGAKITVGLDVVDDDGGRYCRVMVEDNGPGIPDDYKERVFNRMHKGTARGMGLGLYLVKSLVSSYGGRVWVEDRVKGDHSNGARFVVMLPAMEK